jgi:hypothetical protein
MPLNRASFANIAHLRFRVSRRPVSVRVSDPLEHDPEKPALGRSIRGWKPVSRLREARFGGRRKVGKDHAHMKTIAYPDAATSAAIDLDVLRCR